MSFDEIRFPTAISLGATGGPERRTDVVTTASGREEHPPVGEGEGEEGVLKADELQVEPEAPHVLFPRGRGGYPLRTSRIRFLSSTRTTVGLRFLASSSSKTP